MSPEDWAPLVARVLAGERAGDVAREVGVCGRQLNVRVVHRTRRARGPLSALTPEQRADYDVIRKAKFTQTEALRAIGRADLVPA